MEIAFQGLIHDLVSVVVLDTFDLTFYRFGCGLGPEFCDVFPFICKLAWGYNSLLVSFRLSVHYHGVIIRC